MSTKPQATIKKQTSNWEKYLQHLMRKRFVSLICKKHSKSLRTPHHQQEIEQKPGFTYPQRAGFPALGLGLPQPNSSSPADGACAAPGALDHKSKMASEPLGPFPRGREDWPLPSSPPSGPRPHSHAGLLPHLPRELRLDESRPSTSAWAACLPLPSSLLPTLSRGEAPPSAPTAAPFNYFQVQESE